MTETSVIQIITAATALVAVIVGPLVTLYISKKQSNVLVLAKNRQDWINTLRDEISQIIVVIRSIETIMKIPVEKREAKKLLELSELGKLAESKVKLLINPRNENGFE